MTKEIKIDASLTEYEIIELALTLKRDFFKSQTWHNQMSAGISSSDHKRHSYLYDRGEELLELGGMDRLMRARINCKLARTLLNIEPYDFDKGDPWSKTDERTTITCHCGEYLLEIAAITREALLKEVAKQQALDLDCPACGESSKIAHTD